jgi:hypothetical protein
MMTRDSRNALKATSARRWQNIRHHLSAILDILFPVVCTENLTPDVVVMKSAKDRV